MKSRRFVRIVLSLCLLCLTLMFGVAESKAQSTSMPMPHKKTSATKPKPMPMGAMAQMGRTTKKQRMDAAIRHADRRADHIRKNRAEVK